MPSYVVVCTTLRWIFQGALGVFDVGCGCPEMNMKENMQVSAR